MRSSPSWEHSDGQATGCLSVLLDLDEPERSEGLLSKTEPRRVLTGVLKGLILLYARMSSYHNL